MAEKHPHADAIERIGREAVRFHYDLSVRAVQIWCKRGVPRIHHKSLRALAERQGVQVPEIGVIWKVQQK